jgi:predicted peroxiredoxin
MTHGIDSELSSVGFTLARGGLTAGMKVCVFLTSSAVDLARRRGAELTHVQPLEPLKAQMEDFVARGVILACPPCVKSRGYTQEDLHTDRGGLRLVSVVADHGPAAVEPNRATVLESRGENLPFGSR